MTGKVCSRCHKCKSLKEFAKRERSKDGKQSYCRECNRVRSRRYYQENREYHLRVILAYRRRRRREMARQIEAIRAANGCALCPEDDPVCLEFHHLDPSEKDFDIGGCSRVHWKWSKILSEIRKCVVLCSNCHKKVHAGKKVVARSMLCDVSMAETFTMRSGTVA